MIFSSSEPGDDVDRASSSRVFASFPHESHLRVQKYCVFCTGRSLFFTSVFACFVLLDVGLYDDA